MQSYQISVNLLKNILKYLQTLHKCFHSVIVLAAERGTLYVKVTILWRAQFLLLSNSTTNLHYVCFLQVLGANLFSNILLSNDLIDISLVCNSAV